MLCDALCYYKDQSQYAIIHNVNPENNKSSISTPSSVEQWLDTLSEDDRVLAVEGLVAFVRSELAVTSIEHPLERSVLPPPDDDEIARAEADLDRWDF